MCYEGQNQGNKVGMMCDQPPKRLFKVGIMCDGGQNQGKKVGIVCDETSKIRKKGRYYV